ncbi:site-2 protease family protein [Actinomycetospora cinnamomea]|uniref:Zinc metalloprotease n=1 Tax=Actinomycetospora cinnamomea TaxID=663609 RepID=A0A2U1F2C9_9PSEU|nr:site-2 protease family protein [Actinomycetospora cinnamomea]PVZ06331.1 Zn-dependent protease [Actinomycetospora cinnamomea]
MARTGTGTERGAVRLGRLAGVPVAAHWSVLGIVVLIAVVMARSELPLLAPGYAPAAYAAAGLAVALLLMVSLLAHEAAHAVVARAHGLGVDGITLWLLGGTTRLRGEPEGPRAELRIAVVGPVVSGVLAGLFALAAGGARWVATDLVVAVLVELAVINLVLAVFNLLPAAPLDGGRVLRAALWARRGDRWGAGIAAARVGQGLGALLLGGGVLLALTVDLGGFWLMILGWFIAGAAGLEERRARLGRALEGVPVAAALSGPPVLVAADAPAAMRAAAGTDPARTAGVLLTGPDGLVGYLPPERMRAAAERADEPAALRRLVVPASRLTTVRPDDPLAPLLGRLAEPDARLVVLAGDTPIGMVSAADVEELGRSGGQAGPVTGQRPGADTAPPPGWWWPGGPAADPDRSPRPSP